MCIYQFHVSFVCIPQVRVGAKKKPKNGKNRKSRTCGEEKKYS